MESTVILSIVRDVIVALSAGAIAFFAWLGLKAWRRELIGREKFKTARSMMRLGSELRANFGWARHILTHSYESADRIPHVEETEAETQVLNEWHAKAKRLNSVIDSLNKLIEIQWEAEILIDEISVQSVKEAVQAFRESYADLSSAISSYFDVRLDEAKTGDRYHNQEWLKELRYTIYSIKEDDFAKKVNGAIDKLSLALKQYVK